MSLSDCDHVCKPGRERMANRRACETRTLAFSGTYFTISGGHYDDGRLGEIFMNAAHANSALDAIISDAAIAISFALQHGADLAAIRAAMKRDARGAASSPIGLALDLLAEQTI
jgi:hypothetical protein